MSTAQKVLDVTTNLGGIGSIVGLLGTLYYHEYYNIDTKKRNMFKKIMIFSTGVIFAGNIVYVLTSKH